LEQFIIQFGITTKAQRTQRKILLNGHPGRLCSFIFSQKTLRVCVFNDEKITRQSPQNITNVKGGGFLRRSKILDS